MFSALSKSIRTRSTGFHPRLRCGAAPRTRRQRGLHRQHRLPNHDQTGMDSVAVELARRMGAGPLAHAEGAVSFRFPGSAETHANTGLRRTSGPPALSWACLQAARRGSKTVGIMEDAAAAGIIGTKRDAKYVGVTHDNGLAAVTVLTSRNVTVDGRSAVLISDCAGASDCLGAWRHAAPRCGSRGDSP